MKMILRQSRHIIFEIFLIVWIIFCMTVSLIKFGTYAIEILGPTGKIPSKIRIAIGQADQWLNLYIWRIY